MNRLRFNLNGRWVEEPKLSPTTTLLRYLRDRLSLTGTKEGCAEGDCGACTVAIAEAGLDGKPQWRAVNSCLVLMPMVQGKTVLTVEALRAGDGTYHPAQEAMAKALGSQCGYCTPGIVMALFEATYRPDIKREAWKLDDQLCGNLCRCTGYRPIRTAAEQVAGSCPKDRFAEGLSAAAPQSMELRLETEGQKFFTPVRMGALWDVLDFAPEARFVVGGTDLSLEITKKFAKPALLVSLEGIPELKRLEETEAGFRIGAGAVVSDLEVWATSRLPSLARMARYFGARQIKHRGTVGGNLCNASPIGDLAPALISLGASVVLASRAGERRLKLEDFFVGYRKTALQPKEILAFVEVPRPGPSTRAVTYKVSKRRELDISTVAAGFLVELGAGGEVIRAQLAFGGMAATPKRAVKTEAALLGQPWSAATIDGAVPKLAEDFTPMTDHRGSAGYRAKVAANLLRGFFEETSLGPSPVLQPLHAGTVQTYGPVG
ncbi:MAG: xanthine dehydrogenase small subunit [Myxococcaceae bacterium]|nr:xanthine dehydrogenase small subunit [Myxococcaceae bacterium]